MASTSKGQLVLVVLILGQFVIAATSATRFRNSGSPVKVPEEQTSSRCSHLIHILDHIFGNVKNSGTRAGREAVLLFSRDMVASLVPENRRLRAFHKTALLQPGQSETVTFKLPAHSLAFVDNDGQWTLEAGTFRMQAGKETLEINCTETSKW